VVGRGEAEKVIPIPQPLVNIFGENNQVTLLLDHVIDEENRVSIVRELPRLIVIIFMMLKSTYKSGPPHLDLPPGWTEHKAPSGEFPAQTAGFSVKLLR
jgi:hypothetical protein